MLAPSPVRRLQNIGIEDNAPPELRALLWLGWFDGLWSTPEDAVADGILAQDAMDALPDLQKRGLCITSDNMRMLHCGAPYKITPAGAVELLDHLAIGTWFIFNGPPGMRVAARATACAIRCTNRRSLHKDDSIR